MTKHLIFITGIFFFFSSSELVSSWSIQKEDGSKNPYIPRSSVCVMAIGTRSYCPRPFIVVIALIESRATTTYCCLTFLCVMASWWYQKNASIEVIQSTKCEVNTRHRRRSGLAQAERLREGYRYSVPSGGQPPGIRSWRIGESRLGMEGMRTDRQTDRQSDILSASINTNKRETQFYKLR